MSYIIRDNNAPDLTTQPTWEVNANLGAQHDGTDYAQDKLTVHIILLMNIADGSNAFTYLKAHIRKDDGQVDVKALRDRYENALIQEQYISEANSYWPPSATEMKEP